MVDDENAQATLGFADFDDALCWLDQAAAIMGLLGEINDIGEAAYGARTLVFNAHERIRGLRSAWPSRAVTTQTVGRG